VEFEESEVTLRSRRNDLRNAATRAVLQLLEPLTGFAIDAGLGVSELNSIMRHAAVRSVAARQLEVSHRVNISGIAATTGIPRSKIAKILKSSVRTQNESANRQQKPTNRILAAWHESAKFTDCNGQPADLKLYGRGATFETLVKAHGRGLPARAVLDELIRVSAVEVLSSQKVRAKNSLAVDRGITLRAIRAFGGGVTELLSTILLNIREPESGQFIASESRYSVQPNALALFSKQLSKKTANFLHDVQGRLTEAPSVKKKRGTINVTVLCHESLGGRRNRKRKLGKRRNFRRNSSDSLSDSNFPSNAK